LTLGLTCSTAVFAGACGSSSAHVGPEPPTSLALPSTSTTLPNPRSAAANVSYVRQLAARNQLPNSSAITGVSADGPVIVVTTRLSDRSSAEAMQAALVRALECDNQLVLIKRVRVVMRDGTRVDSSGPDHMKPCTGT
jgi:hypothetical protein